MPLDFKACERVHSSVKAFSCALGGGVKARVYKLLEREANVVRRKLSVMYGLLIRLYKSKDKELFSGLIAPRKLVNVRKLNSNAGFLGL